MTLIKAFESGATPEIISSARRRVQMGMGWVLRRKQNCWTGDSLGAEISYGPVWEQPPFPVSRNGCQRKEREREVR